MVGIALEPPRSGRPRSLNNLDSLRRLDRPRLYEQLIDRLREYVRETNLQAGDRLPSERLLAEQLGVSRNTLKQATLALEVQGMVEVRHGDGTYLRSNDLNSEPIAQLMARRKRLPEILEAREAIETKVAALAAERRTDADLEELQAAVEQMSRSVSAGETGEAGDRRFHAAVVSAAHSPVLAGFYADISEEIAETRRESLKQPDRPLQSVRQHAAILDAILARDADGAVAAVLQHLGSVRSVRLLAWNLASVEGDAPAPAPADASGDTSAGVPEK